MTCSRSCRAWKRTGTARWLSLIHISNVTYASTLGALPQVEDREELKGWAYERMLAALDEHADEEMCIRDRF